MVFPQSTSFKFILITFTLSILLLYTLKPCFKHYQSFKLLIASLILSSFLAFITIYAQRGLDSQTSPLNLSKSSIESPTESQIQLPYHYEENSATLFLQQKAAQLEIKPMLRFISTSPDRSWTIFAPPELAKPHPIQLDSKQLMGTKKSYSYKQNGRINRYLSIHPQENHLIAESLTVLSKDTYSHLNTFCDINFTAEGPLFISFSPCPKELIEITPADYPVGRPARFAYLDKDSSFHIVEATSAEKGPFKTLAQGQLNPTEPFTIYLHNKTQMIFSIEINDWALQASTQISPTAGWGVPENAIEFHLSEKTAYLFTSLASTSVGRGFHSVGHKAGTYWNRLKIKSHSDSE